MIQKFSGDFMRNLREEFGGEMTANTQPME
jgi:hypothetical protein